MSSSYHKNPDEKFCTECGTLIQARAEICPHCGVRQYGYTPILEGRNRIIAALLAFFLGTFGIHKFYLGQTGLGFLYLLFCWTAIPTIVSFIEGVIFITMSDREFASRYNAH